METDVSDITFYYFSDSWDQYSIIFNLSILHTSTVSLQWTAVYTMRPVSLNCWQLLLLLLRTMV